MKLLLPLTRALALLATLLPWTAAQAFWVAWDSCTSSAGNSSSVAMTVNVGRDGQQEQIIGPWFTFPTVTWVCKRDASPSGYVPYNDRYAIRAVLGPANGISRYFFVGSGSNGGSIDGVDYSPFQYNANAKIGFVARIRYEMQDGTDTGFIALKVKSNQPTVIKDVFGGEPRNAGETFWFKATLQIRLIRLGSRTDFPKSVSFPAVRLRLSSHYHDSILGKSWVESVHHTYSLNATIDQLNATCTTPDVQVDLGAVNAAFLNGPGPGPVAGPTRDFALRFEQCPPYMRSISYRFKPESITNVSNGILPLDTTLSTAAGVGVQVLNPDGTPLVFGPTFTALSVYDAHNPLPTYTLPLKARIIRTDGLLTPGTVRAAMQMVVQYR